jgi:TRAP transporter TAXI family solute receptor
VRNTIARTVAALLLSVAGMSSAAAADLGLITGGDNGTYYHFGHDLRRLVRSSGIDLRVYPSKGAVENIVAVHQRRGIHLGIVQSDVLAFVASAQSRPAVAQIARSTRLVLPLYDEQIHVLARPGIGSFDNLAGKRVAIGREGSGTYLTASTLFKLADVLPAERVPIEGPEALAQLKSGRIDALVYVAGFPIILLKTGVTAADGLELIPVASKSILESYAPAEIPRDAYEWQAAAVSTVAVKAILVSSDLRRRECDLVGRVAQAIVKGRDWLAKNGHPKWKAVDLDFRLNGWERYDCVQKYVGKSAPGEASPGASAGERNPIDEAVKSVLGRN